MKNIINPKISNMGSVYISISKKCSKSEDCEQIQNIKFFEETVKLQVPADESGEVCVNVYIDKSKNDFWEKVYLVFVHAVLLSLIIAFFIILMLYAISHITSNRFYRIMTNVKVCNIG